jgi:hypothetical protein
LEESDIGSVSVSKGRRGYCLYGHPEDGKISEGSATIEDALHSYRPYGCDPDTGRATIETNVRLEELFNILNSYSFETLLHNASTLVINDAEIDTKSLKDVLVWYAAARKI